MGRLEQGATRGRVKVGGTEARAEAESGASARASSGGAAPHFGAALLRVAWLAILLGFAMEGLLLLLSAGLGDLLGVGSIVAGLVKNVSWSVFVCAGLAVGAAASTARAPVMGLLGLLSAPLALGASRSLHQGTVAALELAGTTAGGPSPLLLAVIKGVEYGCLGAAVGWIGRRTWGGAMAHGAAGLVVGIFFGGAILALTHATAPEPLPAAALLSLGLNEVLFPVGCSLVLFAAQALGRGTSRGQPGQEAPSLPKAVRR